MPSWLENNIAFYASYHDESRNKLIHFLFVWPIFFTAQTFLLNAPAMPSAIASVFPVEMTWCLLLSMCYGSYYFLIEQPGIAGPFAAFLVYCGYAANKAIAASNPDCWKIALVLHVFAWAAQIFGHQVFEKRAPAFLDNILQALVMAPLFVVLEVFFLFGYKAELHKRVDAIAQANIAEFKASKKTK